jgi:hypothetical protein
MMVRPLRVVVGAGARNSLWGLDERSGWLGLDKCGCTIWGTATLSADTVGLGASGPRGLAVRPMLSSVVDGGGGP